MQVELAAKAGALRQMLLEMLEHPEDIRKMTIMGRTCKVRRQDGSIECTLPLDKQSAEGTMRLYNNNPFPFTATQHQHSHALFCDVQMRKRKSKCFSNTTSKGLLSESTTPRRKVVF